MGYKYCIVPNCHNTTAKTPNKLFISLPADKEARNLWQKAMQRNVFLSHKGSKYCCEDHFNLDEDVENYMYIKTMKSGRVRLRPGVIPHIFKCQVPVNEAAEQPVAYIKSETEELLTDLLTTATENLNVEEDRPEFVEIVTTKQENKSIQVNVNPKIISKYIQCNFPETNKAESAKRKFTGKLAKISRLSENRSGSSHSGPPNSFSVSLSGSTVSEFITVTNIEDDQETHNKLSYIGCRKMT